VSQAERRLGEAAKMGMTTAYMAERGIPKRGTRGLEIVGVRTVTDLFRQLFQA
jgi:DNA repair protein RadA/Sms